MIKNTYNVIGVMSGTSLDGIDLAYINFKFSENWTFKILSSETIPYSEEWRKILTEAVSYDGQNLKVLNERYTDYLAEVISAFIQKNSIQDIDGVCSHGHTIKHEPENGFTLQIGNLPKLTLLLGQTVVCDFRVQDVKLGGQGAPLVPIGDELLFSEYEYCLNLGGFANISTHKDGKRIAYDTCAVNTVLNSLAAELNMPFDRGGKVAASGELDEHLLKKLNSLPFYKKDPPKSLGIEWVNEQIFPLLRNLGSVASALRTYTIHAAIQMTEELKGNEKERVLVTGGGAFNDYLIQELRSRTRVQIIIPSEETVNFKEALIFGFLGVLKLRGENNVLSSVTGASKDHSSGRVYLPQEHSGDDSHPYIV